MDSLNLKKRTIAVLIITVVVMIFEIFFGFITQSMSLTADGFHMGTHAIAFIITLIACVLALKYQNKEDKINAAGGCISAVLLGISALGIIYESAERFINPVSISFEDAIIVAVVGLLVNVLCAVILGNEHHSHHCHHIDDYHEHNHTHDNLNYKATYMHIIADAFTSILAISALLCGKYFGLTFFDPLVGAIGGLIIAKWAFNIISASIKVFSN